MKSYPNLKIFALLINIIMIHTILKCTHYTSNPLLVVCVCACSVNVWPFATVWTLAHQAPLSMEFSRKEYWSRLPFPPSGYLLTQGSDLHLLYGQAGSLPRSHQGSPCVYIHVCIYVHECLYVYVYLQETTTASKISNTSTPPKGSSCPFAIPAFHLLPPSLISFLSLRLVILFHNFI